MVSYCRLSSCACAILIQSGSPGAPQGDFVKKYKYVSHRPHCGLILKDKCFRCAICVFGPVKLPWSPERGIV